MNKNQVKGHGNEAKGREPGDKSTKDEGKAGNPGAKAGAVLGEINDDPREAAKTTGKGAK